MQLGIPRVLVDLRHSATHNVLPSLDSLRGAAAEVTPSLTITLGLHSQKLAIRRR